jgi:hypothetical protein
VYNKNMDIVFTNYSKNQQIEKPKPASQIIPDWYKSMNSYINSDHPSPVFLNDKVESNATIKKCMPVFDSLVSGYIISTPEDIWVYIDEEGQQQFLWPGSFEINFHDKEQVTSYPIKTGYNSYPKFMNPWGIRTPKGYSILILPPLHREKEIFTILPGIVDTDKYYSEINFVFVVNDPNFVGLIPQGTPIAQIIPFKRDSWNMKIGNKDDIKMREKVNELLSGVFFNRYKKMFWTKKEYR